MSNPFLKYPSFLIDMIADDYSETMKIPPLFLDHFGGEVKKRIVLCTSERQQWTVSVVLVEGDLYFQNGWESFIADNEITSQDFISFFYDGDAGFYVKIYGASGCEKKGTVGIVKMEEHHTEAENQEKGLRRIRRKRKFVGIADNGIQANNFCYKVVRAPNDVDNQRALKVASAIRFRNPHFVSTCRKARTGYMTIPLDFVEKYKLDQKKFVSVQDPRGIQRSVKLAQWSDGRICLSTGWSCLYKENDLKEGDVCVFEFVEQGTRIVVHIFRAEEYSTKQAKKSGERLVDPINKEGSPSVQAPKNKEQTPRVQEPKNNEQTPRFQAPKNKEQTPRFQAPKNKEQSSRVRALKNKEQSPRVRAGKNKERSPRVQAPKNNEQSRRAKKKREAVTGAFKSFESRHLAFSINWTLSRLYHLAIPNKIVRHAGIKESQDVVLSVSSGKQWPVKMVVRFTGRIELGSGFADFCRENHLVPGDKCVFQFVAADSIKVHIYRVGESSNSA